MPVPYTQFEFALSHPQTEPRVLVVWDRPDDLQDLLQRRFPALRFEFAATPQQVETALAALDPQILFSIKGQRLAAQSHRIAACHPGLEWIQVGGSGYEHLAPLDLSRVVLSNAAGVLARFLAETVTGVMLAWNSRLFAYRDQQRAARWQPLAFSPLCDRTLLVLGTGAIGRAVAANGRALGMRVLGVNRTPRHEPDMDAVYGLDELERVLPEADYLSVHLRLNDDTAGFINHQRLLAMKPGAFFMNTARGGLVDSDALMAALESGHLSGAYLDVFAEEPLPADHPLWQRDDVIITPHAADQVHDWPQRFAAFFADNLERWRAGEALLNRVQA